MRGTRGGLGSGANDNHRGVILLASTLAAALGVCSAFGVHSCFDDLPGLQAAAGADATCADAKTRNYCTGALRV